MRLTVGIAGGRVYSFPRAVTQTGWVKQQKCIVPPLWRLEVQDQGVGRAGSF